MSSKAKHVERSHRSNNKLSNISFRSSDCASHEYRLGYIPIYKNSKNTCKKY